MKEAVFISVFLAPVIIWLAYTVLFNQKKRVLLFGCVGAFALVFFAMIELQKSKRFVIWMEENNSEYLFLIIIWMLHLLIISVFSFFSFRKRKNNRLKKQIDIAIKQQYGMYRFPTSRGIIDLTNPYRGILVVGGAGSGKSKTFIYSIIQQSAKMDFSGVIYDFKSPELMEFAELMYLESSIETHRIDFRDIKNSKRVNPLEYVNNATESTNYAQALIFNLLPEYISKQDFWGRSVLTVFSGAIWYFRKNKPEMATLPHVFAFLITASAVEIIDILTKDREIRGYLSSLAEAVEQKAERQVAGVLGTLKNAIGLYNNPEIFWILSKNEVNLNANDPQNPCMILVGNNSKLSDSYAPLISLIITICSKLMNESGKHRSTIIIDEAPTLYLPNFEQIPATARSNKVSVVVGTQDLAQMVDKYGKEKADVLVSNLGNQFYGRTTNKETADRVVQMFGQREDIEVLSGTSGQGALATLGVHTGRSKSQTIVKRDRVKIQQVLNFSPGEFAALIAEGNVNDFVGKFVESTSLESGSEILRADRNVTDEIMNENFERIYDEVEMFLNSQKQSFGFD